PRTTLFSPGHKPPHVTMPQLSVRGSKKILLRGPANSKAGSEPDGPECGPTLDIRSSTSTLSAAPTNSIAVSPKCAATGEGSKHLPRSLMATSAGIIRPGDPARAVVAAVTIAADARPPAEISLAVAGIAEAVIPIYRTTGLPRDEEFL